MIERSFKVWKTARAGVLPMLRLTESTSRTLPSVHEPLNGVRKLRLSFMFCLAFPGFLSLNLSEASADSHKNESSKMLEPQAGSLLVSYFELFLRDQDSEAFRRKVSARYNEGSLARVLESGGTQARRASVLALGMFGGYSSNATVARALRDPDPTVRVLADNSLWLIWFRADTPENNESLRQIQIFINRGKLDQAIDKASALIARSPNFAEAYNQRAIAHYSAGRFAESIEDCRKTLARNPFHTGALGGMGQCQLQLGLRNDALETFRRALKLQPYSEGLKQVVADMEAENP
jgi:tetratricopeptide (TPR) repeat protein